MKKFLNGSKLILVNLALFLLLLELIGLLVFFVNNRSFFYTSDQRLNKDHLSIREAVKFTKDKQLTSKRFHPFFGYTYKEARADKKADEKANTNNYGFICPHDYPLKRANKDWFIVGIFGGSVAEDFYMLGGCRRLAEQLSKSPVYAQKEFVFLNFAMGGYKQPQQLQVLTYFLAIGQPLDMAVNIDGFNEMVFCFNNNRLAVDIAMPSAQHFLPMKDLMDGGTLTDEKLDIMWKIRDIKRTFGQTQKRLTATPFAALHLVYSAYNNYLYKKYRQELVRFDNMIGAAPEDRRRDSLVNVKYSPMQTNHMQLTADVASLWYRTSYLMHGSLASRGGRYFHFLQPNQYFSKKKFSPQESRVALQPNSPYIRLTKQGYPVLLQALAILKKKNIRAYSAVEIFDAIDDALYTDSCCHFNQRGHERFADFMAERILLEQ